MKGGVAARVAATATTTTGTRDVTKAQPDGVVHKAAMEAPDLLAAAILDVVDDAGDG